MQILVVELEDCSLLVQSTYMGKLNWARSSEWFLVVFLHLTIVAVKN